MQEKRNHYGCEDWVDIDVPQYSKTCVKRPLKNRQTKDLSDK